MSPRSDSAAAYTGAMPKLHRVRGFELSRDTRPRWFGALGLLRSSSPPERCGHRRVVRWVRSAARFAVDPGGLAPRRQRARREHVVDAQSPVLPERPGTVVPPRVHLAFFVVHAE